jgi:hypothetical protein
MRYLGNAFAKSAAALFSDRAEQFSTDWPSKGGWLEGDVVVHTVFYHFDEPLFFSIQAGPMFLILQKLPASVGPDFYFGSMVHPEIVDAMVANRISVRAAMTAGPIYVVRLMGGCSGWLERYWHVAAASIPEAWWSSPGTCLSDYVASATDTPSFYLGPGGMRLADDGPRPGDGQHSTSGIGFELSVSPSASASAGLWRVISGFLPAIRGVRHRKRGSDYDVMLEAVEVQCAKPINEGDVVSVYVEPNGKGWARPKDEFNDGRFDTV